MDLYSMTSKEFRLSPEHIILGIIGVYHTCMATLGRILRLSRKTWVLIGIIFMNMQLNKFLDERDIIAFVMEAAHMIEVAVS